MADYYLEGARLTDQRRETIITLSLLPEFTLPSSAVKYSTPILCVGLALKGKESLSVRSIKDFRGQKYTAHDAFD